MKSIPLLFIACLLVQCSKEKFIPTPDPSGVASEGIGQNLESEGLYVLINGKKYPFESHALEYSFAPNFFTLEAIMPFVRYFRINEIPIQSNQFYQLNNQTGIKLYTSFIIYYEDGDIVEDKYFPISSGCWLEITNYDPQTRIIEGRFEAELDVRKPKTDSKNPDKIKVEHGYFRLKIKPA